MFKTHQFIPESASQEANFDWCPVIPPQKISWKDPLPFLIGALVVSVVMVWQLSHFIGDWSLSGLEDSHVQLMGMNVVLCLAGSLGLLQLFRLSLRNHSLQRRLQMAGELQAMLSATRKRNRELEVASRTDSLTGVGNRLMLTETLEFEVQRCDRYGDWLSIGLVEIGGLRRLHVGLGRPAVQETVRQVANSLQECMLPSDWIFRWSDGEFVVLWLNTDPKQAQNLSRRIHGSLLDTCIMNGLDVPVSVGSTTYRRHEGVDRFLARADLAKKDLAKGGLCYLHGTKAEELARIEA